MDMVNVDYVKPDAAGLKPEQQLELISESAHRMIHQQYTTYNRMLSKLMREKHIFLLQVGDLTPKQLDFIDHYFNSEIYPVLTPLAVDSSRPFPLILNKSINIATLIHKDDHGAKKREFATIQVPTVLPRVVKLPDEQGQSFILLEDIIRRHLKKLFVGYVIEESACYRVIRDMDLEVDEEESVDLMKEIKKQLRLRERGNAIHLDVEAGISDRLVKKLIKRLEVSPENVYSLNGPIDLTFLSELVGELDDMADLRDVPHRPYTHFELIDHSIFDMISRKDIFLHHPYDSFDPVIEFTGKRRPMPMCWRLK
ncbi:hypothetical protein QS257_10895 [Terrilactibacillus sp. S3-3]|nr:hypothetical protein QS257_10895 [Terrilactibacillus sp. S3-3]